MYNRNTLETKTSKTPVNREQTKAKDSKILCKKRLECLA